MVNTHVIGQFVSMLGRTKSLGEFKRIESNRKGFYMLGECISIFSSTVQESCQGKSKEQFGPLFVVSLRFWLRFWLRQFGLTGLLSLRFRLAKDVWVRLEILHSRQILLQILMMPLGSMARFKEFDDFSAERSFLGGMRANELLK